MFTEEQIAPRHTDTCLAETRMLDGVRVMNLWGVRRAIV
jgi:hypothetical protein